MCWGPKTHSSVHMWFNRCQVERGLIPPGLSVPLCPQAGCCQALLAASASCGSSSCLLPTKTPRTFSPGLCSQLGSPGRCCCRAVSFLKQDLALSLLNLMPFLSAPSSHLPKALGVESCPGDSFPSLVSPWSGFPSPVSPITFTSGRSACTGPWLKTFGRRRPRAQSMALPHGAGWVVGTTAEAVVVAVAVLCWWRGGNAAQPVPCGGLGSPRPGPWRRGVGGDRPQQHPWD